MLDGIPDHPKFTRGSTDQRFRLLSNDLGDLLTLLLMMLLLTFAAACPVDYVLVAQTRCLRLFTNHDAVQLVTSTSAGRSRDDQLANVTWYYKTDLVTWSRGDHVTW